MSQQLQRYLRVVFSPGINPDKWLKRFDERVSGWWAASAAADDPLVYVDSQDADVAIVRLGRDRPDPQRYHSVILYHEQAGVAAPKEHPIEVLDAVRWSELSDEMLMYTTPADGVDDLKKLREMLEVVAANVGVAVAPRPLLRALNTRGVVHRDLHLPKDTAAADLPGPTMIGLVWLKERDAEEVQEFVGICRGRKAGSSRGALSTEDRGGAASKNAKKRSAQQKSAQQKKGARKRGAKGKRPVRGKKL